jgi:ABC-2 type transport system ATP-binding protein
MITMTQDAVIETNGMSKWFGEVMAVNNLHVRIRQGVTGLLGPNGAGKSTFIKLALGLYRPSRGTIRVFGQAPRNNLPVLRRIGYCPESDKFYEHMSGYEFIYWLNRAWGMKAKDAEAAAEQSCEAVKMSHRMDDPIETYSKGMRQRVKIAQSLAINPDLLFLDEPMSGLDPKGREDMSSLIRHLGQQGKTVVVSSHILYEIERVTDSVVLLHGGSVLAQGNVREIRDLIDEHPHAVTVESAAPHAIGDLFVNDDTTLSIEFSAGAVTVRTRDPHGFYEKLNRLVLDEAIQVQSIRCPDDNLQSVFEYLVN